MSDETIMQLVGNLDSVCESSDVPAWALELIKCFKGLIVKLENIQNLDNRINELESYQCVSKLVSENLATDNKRINDELVILSNRVDDFEQRSRNSCLLIHGINEVERENTDDVVIGIIKDKLNINLTYADIQRSHRIGKRNTNQRITRLNKVNPRPIIFKFVSYRKRKEVFSQKKHLKGSNISITESLTANRLILYKAASNFYGKGMCWTNDDRVTTKVDNRYITINSLDDLHS